MIRSSISNERLTLKAYGSTIQQIAEEVVCNPLALLSAKPFTVTYNDRIVQCIRLV